MTEETDNKNQDGAGTVRVPEWVLSEMEKKLNAMPRKGRPSRGDLVAEAWKLAYHRDDAPSPQKRMSARDIRAHELLQFVLDHGTAKQAEWIIGNLQTFKTAVPTPKKPLGKLGS